MGGAGCPQCSFPSKRKFFWYFDPLGLKRYFDMYVLNSSSDKISVATSGMQNFHTLDIHINSCQIYSILLLKNIKP
jgi:hypothetical protein